MLLAGLGVEGDVHAGVTVKHRSRVAQDPTQPNLRQVHLIHEELFAEVSAEGFTVVPGDLGENITTRDIAGDVIGWSQHRVDPRDGELAIYVATLTATPTLSASVEYHPRWDVYAAPIQIEEASA